MFIVYIFKKNVLRYYLFIYAKTSKISMTNDKNSAKALEVWPIVCRKGIAYE